MLLKLVFSENCLTKKNVSPEDLRRQHENLSYLLVSYSFPERFNLKCCHNKFSCSLLD